MGDLELFLLVQGDPRRLLPVAQRLIEDQDAVCSVSRFALVGAVHGAVRCVDIAHVVRAPSLSRFTFLSAWYAARRPPRAIPPEGGAGEAREASCETTSEAQGSTARSGLPTALSGRENY